MEKVVKLDFGDLPVNLRQEILNLLRTRNITSPEITITGLATPQRPIRTHQDLGPRLPRSHDPVVACNPRTELDVMRELSETAGRTGCPGIVDAARGKPLTPEEADALVRAVSQADGYHALDDDDNDDEC